jgi:hypothetical protein
MTKKPTNTCNKEEHSVQTLQEAPRYMQQSKDKKHETMRHPAAPTIIAVLLGFLAFMVLWARWRGDGHHEGNPHPDDIPLKVSFRRRSEGFSDISNTSDTDGDGD